MTRVVPEPAIRPGLVLGPILRFTDQTRATIWVETDAPCTVEVVAFTGSSARERTWGVGGHHYAIVQLDGLPPDSIVDYSVRVVADDASDAAVTVWPPDGGRCRFTTATPDTGRTIAFGSCRRGDTHDAESVARIGADALTGLAHRVAGDEIADPERGADFGDTDHPDLMLFLGDQVYADDPSREVLARLHKHRARHVSDELTDEVANEICDFEEYTWLYHESWGSSAVRNLLASVPSCMILDDHDLRDDWNSSADWRRDIVTRPWWRRRVIGAFTSYWIYQHLGNLSPEQLAADETYAAVRAAPTDAAREELLTEFSLRADAEPGAARWSVVRDLGDTRLILIDSRCSRVLEPSRRAMLDDTEWQWIRDAALAPGPRHIVFGTSLPYLMLPALHHLEQWSEAVAGGVWGARAARVGEKLRLGLDLEHWAAFESSFHDMAGLVDELTAREESPASIVWLSGDVHCSYVARARLAHRRSPSSALYQLTMSPFRNPLERPVRAVNRIARRSPVVAAMGWLAARAGAGAPAVRWTTAAGPWFDNGVMLLIVRGDTVTARVEHAYVDDAGAQRLSPTHTERLVRG